MNRRSPANSGGGTPGAAHLAFPSFSPSYLFPTLGLLSLHGEEWRVIPLGEGRSGNGAREVPQTRDQGPGVAPRWLSALGQVWASGLCLLICPVGLGMPVSHRAEDLATLGLISTGRFRGFPGGPLRLGVVEPAQ